jgi:coenzyme F420-dependent glucose-6-phosphate dehydrogenase
MSVIGYHASHEQYPPAVLLEHLKAAEKSGFAAAMCSDHFAPWSEQQGESGFAWSWLGAALESTSFTMGTVNAPGYRYNPAIIAQAAATLSAMYPKRFWIALGSGQALNEHITGDRWPEKPERNARLERCAEIMRSLWAGETVSSRGLIELSEARLHSLAEQPPLIFGAALSPETAAWVATWADGMITIGQPLEDLREVVDAFRTGGGEGKPMLLQEQISWAEDEETAREYAYDQWRYNILEPPVLERLAHPAEFEKAAEFVKKDDLDEGIKISADLDQHIEWLEQDIALGFDQVLVHHVGRENQREFIEVFGEQVIPRLHERTSKGARGDAQEIGRERVLLGAD